MVKYEHLVSKSQASLQKIMDFLGLPFEEKQLNPLIYGADARSQLDVFKKLANPIDTASVGRYILEMRDSERHQFERIARNELSYYGYL